MTAVVGAAHECRDAAGLATAWAAAVRRSGSVDVQLGGQSGIAVALRVHGEPRGLLVGVELAALEADGEVAYALEAFAEAMSQVLGRLVEAPRGDHLQSALDQFPQAVFALRPDGSVLDCNRVARERFSGDSARTVFQRHGTRCRPDGRTYSPEPGIAAALSGRVHLDEVCLGGESDSRPARVLYFPIRDAGGIRAVGLNIRDMLREIERQEDLRHWVRIIAHELKQPLQVMKLTVAIAQRRASLPRSSELRLLLERLQMQTQQTDDLVQSLTQFAIYDAVKLDLRPVELSGLVSAHARALAPLFAGRSLEVHGDAVVALGDATAIREILGNLLANTLRHTPSETPVVVRVGAEGERAVVSVVDSGPGLDAAKREEVSRALCGQTVRIASERGMGLGLAFVGHLARACGGTLEVRANADGCGVTFALSLPRRLASDCEAAPGT